MITESNAFSNKEREQLQLLTKELLWSKPGCKANGVRLVGIIWHSHIESECGAGDCKLCCSATCSLSCANNVLVGMALLQVKATIEAADLGIAYEPAFSGMEKDFAQDPEVLAMAIEPGQ